MGIAIIRLLKNTKLLEVCKPRKIKNESYAFFTHEVELMGQTEHES